MAKKKFKDTDYLTISAYLRAKEARMLDSTGFDRLLSSASFEDAAHILSEFGYGTFPSKDMKSVNEVLNTRRGDAYAEILDNEAARPLIEIFARKYDYHNVKVMVKAQALSTDGSALLSDGGTVDKQTFAELWNQEEGLPSPLRETADSAKALMAGSGDPQLVDIAVDKAYFAEILRIAKATRIPFIVGYVNALRDSANLRTAVRCIRMGRSGMFLNDALIDGSAVDTQKICEEMTPAAIREAYSGTGFEAAAALAEQAVSSDSVTALERACDEAVNAHLATSILVGFGAEVVLSYLVELENEITSVRMILSGKLSGIAPEQIRERLGGDHV